MLKHKNFLKKRIFWAACFTFIFLGFFSVPTSFLNSNELNSSYVPGEIIIKFKESYLGLNNIKSSSKTEEASLKLQALNNKAELFAVEKKLELKDTLAPGKIGLLKTKTNESIFSLIERLKEDPRVEYAEPNGFHTGASIDTDDPYKDLLWGLDNTGQTVNGTAGTTDADVDAPEAWLINEGTNDDVIVAIVDVGVAYNHADLLANMWDGTDCVDENGAVLGGCNHGYNYVLDNGSPLPHAVSGTLTGHGTHLAGTIGAVKNNTTGVIGLAPNVKMMALTTDYTYFNIASSLDFARENGAKVVNASYGGTNSSLIESQAMERFTDAGGLIIACAHNQGVNNDLTPMYPASYNINGIISIANSDQNDNKVSNSNWGPTSVDVAAPGKNIYSTYCTDDCSPGSYTYLHGTSMSTALVSGLAALIWGTDPTLTNIGVKNIILSTGDMLASFDNLILTEKRVNAYNALNILSSLSTSYTPNGGYTEDGIIPASQISYSSSTGYITINFKLKDTFANLTETLSNFSYSVDGGNTWQTPTNGDSSASLSNNWNSSSAYLSALDYSGSASSFTFYSRNSEAVGIKDVLSGQTKIRFKISDGINTSGYITSEAFSIDNSPCCLSISQPNAPILIDTGTYDIIGSTNAGSLVEVYKNDNLIDSLQLDSLETDFTIIVDLEQNAVNSFVVKATDPIYSVEKTSNLPSITESFLNGWTQRINSGLRWWVALASSADGAKLVAGNYSGYLYTSTDSGITWTERANAGFQYWYSLASSADGTKLIAPKISDSGYIYTSTNSGITWEERNGAGSRQWISVASSADGAKLAVVPQLSGYVYTSIDSGATWTQQAGSGSRSWHSITSSSDGVKLAAVVSNGYIYTSTDSGVNWTTQTNAGSRAWYAIASSSDGTKLAATVYNGYIYTSTDSGATWTAQTNAGSRVWRAIASSSDGTKLAAAVSNGYIYTSTDSGINWTAQTNLGSKTWYSIASSSDGNKLVAGPEDDFIYTYSLTTPVFTTESASSITASSATLNGTIVSPGGEYVATRGFEYGLTTGYGSTVSEEGSFDADLFEANVSDLSPGVTYHFRSYGTNSQGTSYGEDQTFTTISIPTLTTSSATNLEQTTATLNGEITNTGGENSTERGFEYGLTTSYGSTASETGSFSTGTFSADLTNLTCGTAYHFRSYATNSAGTGYGEDTTFNTDECDTGGGGGGGGRSGSSNNLPPPIILPVLPINDILCPNGNTQISNCTQKPVSAIPVISRTLKFKMTGEDVKNLQKFLNQKGYFVSLSGVGSLGKETNYFGLKTKQAVIKFQKAHNLVPDGVVGPKTRGEIK